VPVGGSVAGRYDHAVQAIRAVIARIGR
jgi:hypothetical protein